MMAESSAVREVKLVAIGNSKGIRLPKSLIRQYGWSGLIVMEEAEDGVFLRARDRGKLSWKDTYRAMAAAEEDWSDFDIAAADGID